MLYKNLPEEELHPVMCMRGCLDILAVLQFLLKGEWGNARAVFRARKDYARMRPSYQAVRTENLSKTTHLTQPERFAWSLLWKYYAKRVRRFSAC